MPADRADYRSTLHTAHLMGCLAEDVDEDLFETLWPTYFDEPAPETEVDDEAKSHQLAQTILAHFA